MNSTQFVQLLEQDLLTLEEKSKEYFIERLVELFQYKEIESVMINQYASFGVEIFDNKKKLTFIATNNAINDNNNYNLSYHLIVHDNENNIHLLHNIIKRYEDIYKKIYAINSKYVTAHEKPQSQNLNTPRFKIERNNIDEAKKMFFSPEHYQKYAASKEKEYLENNLKDSNQSRNHFKV